MSYFSIFRLYVRWKFFVITQLPFYFNTRTKICATSKKLNKNAVNALNFVIVIFVIVNVMFIFSIRYYSKLWQLWIATLFLIFARSNRTRLARFFFVKPIMLTFKLCPPKNIITMSRDNYNCNNYYSFTAVKFKWTLLTSKN